MNGWVKISRAVTNHPMFEGRADWLGAWVMLIAKANYEDKHIQRGQVRLSHAGLQKLFGWSRKKVRYFLEELRSNGMISWADEGSRKGQVGATITICNYCKFQGSEEAKGHVGATLGPQTERRKKEEEEKTTQQPPCSDQRESDVGCDRFELEKKLRDAAGNSLSQFAAGLNDISEVRLLIADGFDLDRQILPVIREHSGKSGISSWKYFATIIRKTCGTADGKPKLTKEQRVEQLKLEGYSPRGALQVIQREYPSEARF